MSNATANEQLMLELINHARLDPLGEAARYGIDLNSGLPAGTISSAPKQPLAMNDTLTSAAHNHSQYMIDHDEFAHDGIGDGDPESRMTAAGYMFTGAWEWAENIAWQGTTVTLASTSAIYDQHRGLFLSSGHRENTLSGNLREVGVSQVLGDFTQNGTTYHSSMITQDFAKSGTALFLLGVAFNDMNGDNFYTVGEARAGVLMAAQLANGGTTFSDTGGSAGGYEVGVAAGTYNVTFSGGGLSQAMTVQVALNQNIKLDVLNGNTILSSGSLTLGSGATRAKLLGVANTNLTGASTSDTLTGNSGRNNVNGLGGNDTIIGGAGIDTAVGFGTRVSYTITRNGAVTTVTGGATGTDTLSGIERLAFSDTTITLPQTTGSSDFNADGKSDFLWQNTNGQAAIWLMNGANAISGPEVGSNPGMSWLVKGAGDFDADSDADILWQNTNGQALIWFMNGTTRLSGANAGTNPGSTWHVISGGDFNGDGMSDILWQNTSGQAAVWIMNGATKIGAANAGTNPGSTWHEKGSGDFNGDGKADILWQNSDGQAAIWLMNGTTRTAGGSVGSSPGAAWQIKGAGDFNGDGKSDILWQNTSGQAAIWLMNGMTRVSAGNAGSNPGAAWHVIGAEDLNGDGRSDIVWQNTSGQASVWFMNGLTRVSAATVGSNPGSAWHLVTAAG